MRRSRRRTTKTEEKSSSDESDHRNTMNIIDKMSKKLLGSEKPASRLLRNNVKMPSNTSSTPRLHVMTRSRSKSRHDSAYEADIDSSAGTTSPSDTDLYDFDKSNEDDLCLVLFPSKLTSTGKRTLRLRKTPATNIIKLPLKPKQTGYKLNLAGLETLNEQTNLAKRSTVKQKQSEPKSSSNNKRKNSPSQSGSMSKKSHLQKISDESLFDSGVFMSPIEHVSHSSLMTPNLTQISTPSLSLSNTPVDHCISAIEFDSLLEPPPQLSPVKTNHLTSPSKQSHLQPMDLGSPQLKSPVGKTYSHRGLFMTPLERLEKKSKIRAVPRITAKRVDAWASKMNAEFEELEMYDLSID